MKNRPNMGWSSPLPFTTVSFCMSQPFYLKTNWFYSAEFIWCQFLDGKDPPFWRRVLHGIRSSPYWMDFPGGCGEIYFSTTFRRFHKAGVKFPAESRFPDLFQGWIIVMIVFFWTESNVRHFHLSVSILHGQRKVSSDSHINACVPCFRITN